MVISARYGNRSDRWCDVLSDTAHGATTTVFGTLNRICLTFTLHNYERGSLNDYADSDLSRRRSVRNRYRYRKSDLFRVSTIARFSRYTQR